MKRLPPAKRNQLLVVIVVTIVLICSVIFILILPQKQKNAQLARTMSDEQTRLQQYKSFIKLNAETTNALNDLTQQLSRAEDDVITGDVYAWTYDTFRRFKAAYHVDIPNIGQPSIPSDVDWISGIPYKQIKLTLAGTAFYHDLGKFIADLENKFPHMRVANLQAEPANSASGPPERLNFRMEIIALTKANT